MTQGIEERVSLGTGRRERQENTAAPHNTVAHEAYISSSSALLRLEVPA